MVLLKCEVDCYFYWQFVTILATFYEFISIIKMRFSLARLARFFFFPCPYLTVVDCFFGLMMYLVHCVIRSHFNSSLFRLNELFLSLTFQFWYCNAVGFQLFRLVSERHLLFVFFCLQLYLTRQQSNSRQQYCFQFFFLSKL